MLQSKRCVRQDYPADRIPAVAPIDQRFPRRGQVPLRHHSTGNRPSHELELELR